MDLIFRDIHKVKEVFFHKTEVTLQRIRIHRIVLIQVKCDHIFKTEAFFLMKANKFVVDSNGSGACSQSKNGIRSEERRVGKGRSCRNTMKQKTAYEMAT